MDLLFPILAAILQAGSFTLDKKILSTQDVTYRHYAAVSFPLSFLITLVIFLFVRPDFSWSHFTPVLSFLLLGLIVMSIVKNMLFYQALENDGLAEIETLDLLHFIPIVLISSLVFADERNLWITLLALVAGAAVFWSHWEHHHLAIKKRTLHFFIWSFVIAPFGAIASKTVLGVFNPIAMEAVRSGGMGLTIGSWFHKYIRGIPLQTWFHLILTNTLTSVAWILYFFSFQRSGIVYTVLVFSLQPFLVYLSSLIFFHERPHVKKLFAFVVVLVAITLAQVF